MSIFLCCDEMIVGTLALARALGSSWRLLIALILQGSDDKSERVRGEPLQLSESIPREIALESSEAAVVEIARKLR